MINVCVFPFTEKGLLRNLGYQFIRASPLAELHVPNVDFLLYKSTQKIAIFGEAKGSIRNNPDDVINQFNNRIKIIFQNEDYIKTNYLKLKTDEKVYFEFVLAVPSKESVTIFKKTFEKGGGIIVWHAPITGDETFRQLSHRKTHYKLL